MKDNGYINDLINKGYELGELGKYDEAIKCYDEAIRINPEDGEAWFGKGYELGELGKHNKAIKCYDEAIRINPEYNQAWYNKGVNLGKLGKHNKAIKCYDEAIRINPEYNQAWYNKGYELGELGKHNEAIKCHDEAIRINPEDGEAWFGKGYELGTLGKHDKAIKCYDEAIRINPEDAKAFSNIGTSLVNLHEYKEAINKLKEAKKIFKEKKLEKNLIKVNGLIELANNAFEFISKLEIIDYKFLGILKSKNFNELKEKSFKLSKEINKINKVFIKRKIPADAIKLLESKTLCFISIYNVLTFKKVDINELQKTKEVFEKWNYITLALAVSSLEIFIESFSKYKSLEEVSKKDEKYFLDFLKSSSYILDGNFTERISEKFNTKTPFKILTAKREYKKPRIKEILISRESSKNKVRFCLVQLDYNLETLNNEFGYIVKERHKIKEKVFEALKISKEKKVDIVVFPELCFEKKWTEEIQNKFEDMIIVGGSYYDSGFNVCPIFINGKAIDQQYKKITPSPKYESQTSTFMEDGMKSGNTIYVFDTKYGRFSVLTCADYTTNSKDICEVKGGVDFIINPCYDFNIHRFQHRCNSDCEDFDIIVIQVNRSAINIVGNKLYGETCIIGKEDKDILEKLRNNKIKPEDDITLKLSEFNRESLIIVDIDFKKKPTKPTSITYQGIQDIKEVREYKKNKWIKIKKITKV